MVQSGNVPYFVILVINLTVKHLREECNPPTAFHNWKCASAVLILASLGHINSYRGMCGHWSHKKNQEPSFADWPPADCWDFFNRKWCERNLSLSLFDHPYSKANLHILQIDMNMKYCTQVFVSMYINVTWKCCITIGLCITIWERLMERACNPISNKLVKH